MMEFCGCGVVHELRKTDEPLVECRAVEGRAWGLPCGACGAPSEHLCWLDDGTEEGRLLPEHVQVSRAG